MRPVHIAGFAQLPHGLVDNRHDEGGMVRAVTAAALQEAGLGRDDVGFTCSGSSDYIMGRPFSFVMALDGIGAWPPIRESHVEMDGAWALYEAWVRLQHGDVDVALVYCFGKSSLGDVEAIYALQNDPYTIAPLGLDPMTAAALQARQLIARGLLTEREIAETVVNARRNGQSNAEVPAIETRSVEELLAQPLVRDPLRAHDAARFTDGAAAIVLTVGGGGPRIAGIDHRIDSMNLGVRDLTLCNSARIAAERAGAHNIDAAELYVPYASQEKLLCAAMGLGPGVQINPSGGTLVAETPMVAGLVRIGEAARLIRSGAKRTLAHATAGPCLQQNLVCVLEEAS